jgi:hypothetical protein
MTSVTNDTLLVAPPLAPTHLSQPQDRDAHRKIMSRICWRYTPMCAEHASQICTRHNSFSGYIPVGPRSETRFRTTSCVGGSPFAIWTGRTAYHHCNRLLRDESHLCRPRLLSSSTCPMISIDSDGNIRPDSITSPLLSKQTGTIQHCPRPSQLRHVGTIASLLCMRRPK